MNYEATALEFDVDQLENRLLMAADITVRGENVSVVGDDGPNAIDVYESMGTIWVDADGVSEDTGLTSIKNLKIVTKGSGDAMVPLPAAASLGNGDIIHIENEVEVTGRTTINMGSGLNDIHFGGLHNKAKIIGGKDSDFVFLAGGIGTSTNTIALKGGNDSVYLDAGEYFNSATGDTPLADYLNEAIAGIDTSDPFAAIDEAIGLLPKIKANLGSGDDFFGVTLNGSPVDDSDLLDGLNYVSGMFGLGTFASLEEAATLLESSADSAGIKIPQFIKVIGGSGNDTMAPGSSATIFDLFGFQKKFENFGMSMEV